MKHWKLLLSLLFAIAVFWFWAFPYDSVLSYQEQYQLFLFNGSYFMDRVRLPGGLADYLSEFLVQFYYVPLYGAIILALLFFLLQRLSWALGRVLGSADCWYPLTFLPVIVLWFVMSDENVLLSFHVSLLAVLVLCWLYGRYVAVRGIAWKALSLLVTIPVAYWLFGPSIYVLMVWVAVLEMRLNRSLQGVGLLGGMSLIALCTILVSSWLPYEFHRFFIGLNYFRYPVYNPSMQFLVMALLAFIPPLIGVLPKSFSGRRLVTAVITQILVLVGGCGVLIYGAFNNYKYQLIEYDYLVRSEQWNVIISKAERQPAMRPLDVSCVNLALSQKGLLAERLFDFYQNGVEGLFPAFTRDMTSPVSTAEIFFRLGMVNDAHRYMFEAQEAIPNYRKSGRMTKRIIQCEIANGQYDVARKFLRRLRQTLFYRQWALSTLELLENEKSVDSDPLYGKLRSLRHKKEDYLFSDGEMDQMLGMLFTGNMANRMAYEYLMCYVLLQRDMGKFMSYYSLGQYVGYKRIPRAIQEVLIGNWLKKHPDPKTIPYSVDGTILDNTINFIRIYVANPNNPQLNQYPYASNAWNYLLKDSPVKTEEKTMREVY